MPFLYSFYDIVIDNKRLYGLWSYRLDTVKWNLEIAETELAEIHHANRVRLSKDNFNKITEKQERLELCKLNKKNYSLIEQQLQKLLPYEEMIKNDPTSIHDYSLDEKLNFLTIIKNDLIKWGVHNKCTMIQQPPAKNITIEKRGSKTSVSRTEVRRIYKEYHSYYEERSAYWKKQIGDYGSEKRAVADTIAKILSDKGIKINPRNFREHIHRTFDRTQLKSKPY